MSHSETEESVNSLQDLRFKVMGDEFVIFGYAEGKPEPVVAYDSLDALQRERPARVENSGNFSIIYYRLHSSFDLDDDQHDCTHGFTRMEEGTVQVDGSRMVLTANTPEDLITLYNWALQKQ